MRAPRIDIRRYPETVVSHAHTHHQVVVSLAGTLEMEVGGRTGRADPEHAAVIRGNTLHSFAATPQGRFLVLDLVAREHDGALILDASTRTPFMSLAPETRQLFNYLADRLARSPASPALALHASALMLDALDQGLRQPDGAGLPGPLRRAIAFIETHLDRAIGVADIASACGRSPGRMQALFRERLGIGPGAWLQQRRMQLAASLLAASAHPVSEIAARVGYQDPAAFARAFRRANGQSPRAYREQQRTRTAAQATRPAGSDRSS